MGPGFIPEPSRWITWVIGGCLFLGGALLAGSVAWAVYCVGRAAWRCW